MSFPRAAIKRFNEASDTTIPPPGTYDPKFSTDVAVSSAKLPEKGGRGNGGKARPEGNELFPTGGVSRNPSCTRRRSMTSTGELPDALPKREFSISRIIQNKLSSMSKSHLPRPRSITCSRVPRAASSKSPTRTSVKSASASPLKALESLSVQNTEGEVEVIVIEEEREKAVSFQQENQENVNGDPPPIPEVTEVFKTVGDFACHNVIQEIQEMAESLQVEVAEYKRRLSEEIIRSNELESRKLESELSTQVLTREIRKYESAQEAWERQETSLKLQLEELSSVTDQKLEEVNAAYLHLQNEKHNLELECNGLKDMELILTERISKLEDWKSLWELEKMESEKALQLLQGRLAEEESKRDAAEEKCKVLMIQLSSSRSGRDNDNNLIIETRVTDYQSSVIKASVENITELYMVKMRELAKQKELLKKDLDVMKQELEEGTKTKRPVMEVELVPTHNQK